MPRYYLTIDAGNTRTKAALFDCKGEMLEAPQTGLSSLVERWSLSPSNTLCALVSVSGRPKPLEGFPVFCVADYFNEHEFLGMPVNYSKTLGLDRLILAYGSFPLEDHIPCALIDSGTFTTLDIIDQNGFQGGYILPGLEALAHSYEKGFLLKQQAPKSLQERTFSIPKDSEQAMASGLFHSFVAPIETILTDIKVKRLKITGGNGKYLVNALKTSNFQRSASILFDSNLIHKALFKFLLKVSGEK